MTTSQSVHHNDFRDAMAHLAAPVSVITTMDGNRPHGTTVSALMSLSAQPPLIAVSLAHTSDCLPLITQHTMFGVNILNANQTDIALQFATKGTNKFDHIDWHPHTLVPHLTGTAVWLACHLHNTITSGDHDILIGEVTDIELTPHTPPLTYHDRQFGTHHAHKIA